MQSTPSIIDSLKDQLIYLADDDSAFLKAMTLVIEDTGAAVSCFRNGEELLKASFDTPPKLILLDLNMPLLNGFDVLKQLNKEDDYKHIPVLVLSGACDDFNMSQAFELGANDYITKPFSHKELLFRIANHLNTAKNIDTLLNRQQELARFNKAMIDREFRIIELKKEVNALCTKYSLDEKYQIPT